jgi:SNF2 family DNA or RNA helicase
MPKASGPGPHLVTRCNRTEILTRATVCLRMKEPIEAALKPYYPAKIRQQIFFPDRKLVQFDSGKLQTLSNLLRQMKAGGHKCLIFTQMSKMLDILEVFLNLHAHSYVRLDGSTGKHYCTCTCFL